MLVGITFDKVVGSFYSCFCFFKGDYGYLEINKYMHASVTLFFCY